MAAAEGPVAECFANFEEKKRKLNLLMSFPKTGNQMGSFGQIGKNLFFHFCRPILDIFGFTLLTDYQGFMMPINHQVGYKVLKNNVKILVEIALMHCISFLSEWLDQNSCVVFRHNNLCKKCLQLFPAT